MEQRNRNGSDRKERFESPQAEVILFGTEDVITSSGAYGISSFDGCIDTFDPGGYTS